LALEQDLAGIIRFLVCVKWYQNFDYFLAMVGDGDGLQDLFTRMSTVEGEIVLSNQSWITWSKSSKDYPSNLMTGV